MKSSIISDSDVLFERLKDLFVWAETVDMAFAWVSSADGTGRHWKAMDLAKLCRAIVGTEFAQTEPYAISAINAKPGRLRLIISSTGTFHPKLILGRRGSQCRAIVGSANFTRAAYTTNTEFSVVLDGKCDDEEFVKIMNFLDSQWNRGVELTPAWLDDYTKVWMAARRNPIIVPHAKLEITAITSLEKSWPEYVELIQAQDGRRLENGYKLSVFGPGPSYFKEIRDARTVFDRNVPFEQLTKEDRALLMGMGASSGLLGTMSAAGYAKEIVNKTPQKIGSILDRLPLKGDVSLEIATELLNEMTALRGVKIGVATRLFSVKRPDLFVSVNNGSKPQLSNVLGGKQIGTVKNYVELLRRVWATEWHRAPKPIDPRGAEIWESRAALLDSALYEQV